MRLDKFLKTSRLMKRRTLAKQLADQGRVAINGQVAKAGTNVSENDEIEITFGQTRLTVVVQSVRDVVRKHEAETMYRVTNEERINNNS